MYEIYIYILYSSNLSLYEIADYVMYLGSKVGYVRPMGICCPRFARAAPTRRRS